MEIDPNATMTITKKVVISGGGLSVVIPKDVVTGLRIEKGMLVEVKIRNTGVMGPIDPRSKK